MSLTLSREAVALLRMFHPETYSIKLPKGDALDELVQAGCVQWVPSWMEGRTDYAITEKGQAVQMIADEPSA